MRLLCIQHVDYERPAAIAEWAQLCGHQLTSVLASELAAWPAQDSFDGLVVLGGPMNIYQHDKHPWLVAEKAWLRQVADSGKPVLGICLGAQLLAEVLGAPTRQGDNPEIGYFPVRFADAACSHPLLKGWPSQLYVMHWHNDTFALPEGAVAIGASDACANQGFIVDDRLVGLQFHLEWDQATLEGLIRRNEELLQHASTSPYIQHPEQMRGGETVGPKLMLFKLLDRLFTEEAR